MKKILFGLLLTLVTSLVLAEVISEETSLNVKATVTNATTQWYYVNHETVGAALSVTVGSCKVEIALESATVCKANTATAFDPVEGVAAVAADNKKAYLINGASCIRANCTSGSGLFLVRRF